MSNISVSIILIAIAGALMITGGLLGGLALFLVGLALYIAVFVWLHHHYSHKPTVSAKPIYEHS